MTSTDAVVSCRLRDMCVWSAYLARALSRRLSGDPIIPMSGGGMAAAAVSRKALRLSAACASRFALRAAAPAH
eukprot:4996706-Pleurochrysis_carterae.AAC.1